MLTLPDASAVSSPDIHRLYCSPSCWPMYILFVVYSLTGVYESGASFIRFFVSAMSLSYISATSCCPSSSACCLYTSMRSISFCISSFVIFSSPSSRQYIPWSLSNTLSTMSCILDVSILILSKLTVYALSTFATCMSSSTRLISESFE